MNYRLKALKILEKYNCELCFICRYNLPRGHKFFFKPSCACMSGTQNIHIHTVKDKKFGYYKICMVLPKNKRNFFTLLHEIGHIAHPKGVHGNYYINQLAAQTWALKEARNLDMRIAKKDLKPYFSIVSLAEEIKSCL